MAIVKRYSSRKTKKTFYVKLFLFAALFFGVGYAALGTKLTINGTTNVSKNTWNVHFENLVETDEKELGESEITSDTAIDFSVNLDKPGDVYSFTVDVVNNGTIDAMLGELLATGLSTEQEKYIDYMVTYRDGAEILEKDALPSGGSDTLLVNVKYRDDITADDLPSENQSIELGLDTTYVQDDGTSSDRRPPKTLYDMIVAQNQENGVRVLDNQASTYVTARTGINFNAAPSTRNGQGVYIRNGTENDTYPVYYYRGAVTNNNVLFGGYCWKMVRTTETGGIKLIYNGIQREVFESTPIESTEYINVTNDTSYAYTYNDETKQWTSTNKTNSKTGTITFSVATAGYYAINYVVSSERGGDKALFYLDNEKIGEYSGEVSGSISLGEIDSTNIIKVEYTKDSYGASGSDIVSFSVGIKTGEATKSCDNTGEDSQIGTSWFNSSDYNANVGYMYGTPNSSTYEAEHLSTKESTSSIIKTYIDTWYSKKMTSYTSYLEDTIWCNDRSFASSNTGTGAGKSVTFYGAYGRDRSDPTPSLECINQNDRFTVEVTVEGRVNGNGALTYPVALLTADELTIAGQGYRGYSTTNYLHTGHDWWSLSPNNFNSGITYGFHVGSSGNLDVNYMNFSYGVRPSVSLKPGTQITKDGDGSVDAPFVVQ